MRFDRTRGSMDALEKKTELTAADALNLFYDLCGDIKDQTGEAADRLPVGDSGMTVTRLNWAGRMLLRMAAKPEMKTGDEEKQERLAHVSGELERLTGELEETEAAAAKAVQEETLLSERQKVLKEKKAGLEQEKEKEQKLKASCAALEQEIRTYREVSVPRQEEELERLTSQLEALCTDCKKKEEEIGRLEQQQKEQDQIKEELENQLAEQQKKKAEKVREWKGVEETLRQMQEETQKLGQQILRTEENRRSLELQKKEKEAELAGLEAWFRQGEARDLAAGIKQCQARIQAFQEIRERLDAEWEVIGGLLDRDARPENSLRRMGQVLDKLEEALEQYRQCYCSVIRQFDDGGKKL
ncbi:MAG: hypothetical protein ACLU6W_08240 [Lachnospiraceae bacterium]|nr:hypothetical protein [Candidatus Fimimorpha excrementavium]